MAKSGTNLGPIDLSSCAISATDHLVCYCHQFSVESLVLMSTSSLQYTIFSFQEYVFSCVKLSPFLQDLLPGRVTL